MTDDTHNNPHMLHEDRVRAWNDTGTDYPRDASAHELFAQQAHRIPQAVALSPEDGTDITYGDLVQRVNTLAAVLEREGVRPGDTVGVALRRSVEGYIAILGILTAGAVYVPLDLDSPAGRIETILTDAACRRVVTSQDHHDLLPASVGVLDVNDLPTQPLPPPDVRRAALDPAYVMYTSGSTGAPKGVVVPHRGIVRLVHGSALLEYRSDDVVCGTVNLTFDLSVLDLFGALLNGAQLVVPTRATLLSPRALETLLHRKNVSVMWLGAALFHHMAAERPAMFRTLRCLIAGGEALNPTAVRTVLQQGPPGQLVDGYGPTENTVLCTAHVIDELEPEAESVPIGRPLSNCTAYVVRSDETLADVGEEGELWVGGDGVALGYLNRPELTAERFVSDRFSEHGDGRLYRTGDMARWRADGVLEFLGRRDRQVKLGSFRVELREIEIALAAHPQVKEAVVAVRKPSENEQRLCGWVVADEDTEQRGLPMRLRSYLRDRLPVFMVPQQIDVIDAMPVNASGKVDRAALPDHSARSEVALPAEERPRGQTEEAVVAVWQEVLGIPAVRRSDNFFSLGGQSLQGAQVAAALGRQLDLDKEYGGELIRILLGNPTVASFADQVDSLRTSPPTTVAPVDFTAEAELPDGLWFDAPQVEDPRNPSRVLLTGATGFQGVFLLDRLVDSGIPEVWCLIRARDAEHARRRLAGRMRRYGLDYNKVREHVVPVPGDVSSPRLGLTPEDFDQLAASIDVIVHSGSLINFAYPYHTLRQSNVVGVHSLLDLATTHHRKPFHHLSTIITLAGFGTADVRYVMEDRQLDFPERISLGYAESKWVAERLVSQASERGLPVAIYRPYEITGTRDRGIWNTDTLMCAWFRTIAETGLAPDVELPLDFVPVDYTAETIVHILRHEQPDGRVYNITNPRDARLSLLVDRLRQWGYPVRTISYADWVNKVTALTRDNPHHPMTPFMPMFNENAADTSITVKEMYFAETFPEFSRTNTVRATNDAGLELPPVDAALIDRYLQYFLDSGFLTPPTSVEPPEDTGWDVTSESPAETTHKVVKMLQPNMARHVRSNSLYAVMVEDKVGIEHVRRLLTGELHAQPAEIAAFTHLAQRMPSEAARSLFHDVAETITDLQPALLAAAEAVDLTTQGSRGPDVPYGAERFAGFISWLGLNAPAGVAAATLRSDLMLWCSMCAELNYALHRSETSFPEPVMHYLNAYDQAPPPLLRRCADVITEAVDAGEDTAEISRVSQRVDTVLHEYWQSVAKA